MLSPVVFSPLLPRLFGSPSYRIIDNVGGQNRTYCLSGSTNHFHKCLLSFHQLSLSLFIVKGITVIEMHKCWLDLIERENGEETLWNPTIKRRNNSPSYDGYLKDETPKVLLSVHLTDFVGWPLDPPPGHVTSLNPRSCTNSLQKN